MCVVYTPQLSRLSIIMTGNSMLPDFFFFYITEKIYFSIQINQRNCQIVVTLLSVGKLTVIKRSGVASRHLMHRTVTVTFPSIKPAHNPVLP